MYLTYKNTCNTAIYMNISICALNDDVSFFSNSSSVCYPATTIGDLIINDTIYSNILFSYKCEQYIGIYLNKKNGLLRYVTSNNNVFDFYKLINNKK